MIIDTHPDENEAQVARHGSKPSTAKRWTAKKVMGLLLLALVAVFAVNAVWPESKSDVRSGTTLVDEEGMAASYGIKVVLIATSAAGGFIDFRYQVVDPDKASPLLHDFDVLPIFVDEASGATIQMASKPHRHSTTLELGGQYFFLMANARNTLHPGSLVTLVVGDVRMEHLVVQG